MTAVSGDSAAASVLVRVPIQEAFEVFTQEINLWWRHGRKFRIAGARPGSLSLECSLGGRLFETVEFGSGTRTFVVGNVIEWCPPEKLTLEWRNVNFKPHEKTLVEVTFQTQGQSTLVQVRHSGFGALPDEHPAKHGQSGAAFSRQLGMWWGELLSALREYVVTRPPAS